MELNSLTTIISQITSYSMVGVAQNLLGYFMYILVTFLGMSPVLAISILYPFGATLSYFGNKKYTFQATHKNSLSALKFIFVHFLGYLINVIILKVFVDYFGFQHQFIQFIAMLFIAIFLFITMKFFREL